MVCGVWRDVCVARRGACARGVRVHGVCRRVDMHVEAILPCVTHALANADTNSDQSDRDMFDTINSIITISPEKENHNLNNMSMNI